MNREEQNKKIVVKLMKERIQRLQYLKKLGDDDLKKRYDERISEIEREIELVLE